MRNVNMEVKTVDMLSDAISSFIHSVDDGRNLEGAFVVPCASSSDVGVMLLELVCGSEFMRGKVLSADRDVLDIVSMLTGVEVKVETIPYWHYTENNIFDRFDYPIRGMLKSGHIIYDLNGNLETLQKRYKDDVMLDDLSWRGAVGIQPAIQYKK